MRTGSYSLSAVVAGVLLVTGSAGAARSVEPLPVLAGVPLTGPTHLRLIVADGPPFIVDIDRRTVRLVSEVATRRDTVGAVPIKGGALALVYRPCSHCQRERAFVVGVDGSVRRLAIARVVAAATRSATEWAARHGPGTDVTVVDRATWSQRRFRWPSTLGGLDQVIREPHGPLVAVGFADPAYPGPQQAEDLFLLNMRTGAISHVPGFPAQMELKRSSMAWTSDDRLVLLFEVAGVAKIGVYRPGDPAVAVRAVQMPVRNGGSDSFVPIVAG